MASNYEKMADGARALFVKKDQSAMIGLWGLEHDGDFIFATFFGERLRIDRHTGRIESLEPAGVYRSKDWINETMALFDLLDYPASPPRTSGRWASISALGGIIGAGHDRTLSHEPTAAKFAGRLDALESACRRLGGVPLGRADVGFVLPAFQDFAVWFQFWDADEEFPASIKYLFDENALKFMHYETLWYVMNALSERLEFYTRQYSTTR